jgi:betaine-aldehyde dehydrogenase
MSQVADTAVRFSGGVVKERYYCLIGGELTGAASGRTVPTLNPATGEPLADVPDCDEQDVNRAVEAARKAYPAWRKLTAPERAAYCRRFAQRLRERAETYAMLDALNGGNTIRALRPDVAHAARMHEYFAGLATELKGETIPATATTFNFTLREPYGVVGRIVPFNHPVMFAASRLAAPLLAGNTVVLKCADQTPLSALEMSHDLREIFPPGVVNVVNGSGPKAGSPLVKHRDVHRIAFTGSVEVGRQILRDAADGLKAVSLELGGKNPMIVFPDVDLDQAVASAFQGMNYSWQGQSCGSTSRLFLHADIHDQFLARLTERVKAIKVGMPTDEASEMGCLVSERQLDKVMSYINTGKQEGAKLVAGGGRPSNPELARGYFVEPTIFDQVDYKMRLAQEEIFGPVESVITWKNAGELAAMANSVMYGLTASIWSRDFATAYKLAQEIEAGFIWINDSSRHFTGVPFGGYKQSGLGREECLAELLSYTQIKSVNVNLT